jgi:hypothetical protein
MTDEQKKIKFLIDSYHATIDYNDFKTAEECYIFLVNLNKMKHAKEADKIIDQILRIADTENKNIEEWIDIFEDYSWVVGHNSTKQYKLFMDLYNSRKIPFEVQFPLFMNIYVNNNVQRGFDKYLLKSYNNYPSDLKGSLRAELYIKIKDYEDEDGKFTVYRGEYTSSSSGTSVKINRAISFTFDYEMARKFACRKCPEKAYIYTAKVSFDNIICFTNDREESEVLVRPENKGGKLLELNVEEVNPAEYFNK